MFTKLDLKEETVQKQYSLCSYTDKISTKKKKKTIDTSYVAFSPLLNFSIYEFPCVLI